MVEGHTFTACELFFCPADVTQEIELLSEPLVLTHVEQNRCRLAALSQDEWPARASNLLE